MLFIYLFFFFTSFRTNCDVEGPDYWFSERISYGHISHRRILYRSVPNKKCIVFVGFSQESLRKYRKLDKMTVAAPHGSPMDPVIMSGMSGDNVFCRRAAINV